MSRMVAERRVVAPTLVGASIALMSVTTVWFTWRGGGSVDVFLAENQASSWLSGLAYGVLGAVVLSFRRHLVLGVVFAGTGLFGALGATCAAYADLALTLEPTQWPGGDLSAWAGSAFWLPAQLLTWCVLPLVFPDGRLVSARWRWPARVGVVGGVVGICSLATTPSMVHDGWPTADNPFDLPIPEGFRLAVGAAGMLVAAAIGVVATIAIALRMRRSPSPRRQQEAWYVASRAIVVTAGLASLPAALDLSAEVLAAVALAIGILRHRLLDIEALLPRAVVFVGLTAVAVGVYLAAATTLGVRLTGGLGPVVVAAVAAVVLATGRQRAQRAVERLLIGARADPLGALTALGDRLGGALTAEQALPAVVRSVRESMRVPYAAVRWGGFKRWSQHHRRCCPRTVGDRGRRRVCGTRVVYGVGR